MGQTNSGLFHYYAKDRGHAIDLLFFEASSFSYLSLNEPCKLGFCIKSDYKIKNDTLETEKFGLFVIQRNKLISIYNNKLVKNDYYKAFTIISKKTLNCLKFYGIKIDSGRVIIPKRLYGLE